MKLVLCLAVALSSAAFVPAQAQGTRWTSPDGMVSLAIPTAWDHESAPPRYVGDVGAALMRTWVRDPASSKDAPVCEVVRNKLDPDLRGPLKSLPASRFIELTVQLLNVNEAASDGLLDHEIIATENMVGGTPVIDYTTRAKGSAAADYLAPHVRVRNFIAGDYSFGITCSVGQTQNAAEAIEAFINSVAIHQR